MKTVMEGDWIPRKISKLLLMGMDNWATGEDTTASGVASTHSLFGTSKVSHEFHCQCSEKISQIFLPQKQILSIYTAMH